MLSERWLFNRFDEKDQEFTLKRILSRFIVLRYLQTIVKSCNKKKSQSLDGFNKRLFIKWTYTATSLQREFNLYTYKENWYTSSTKLRSFDQSDMVSAFLVVCDRNEKSKESERCSVFGEKLFRMKFVSFRLLDCKCCVPSFIFVTPSKWKLDNLLYTYVWKIAYYWNRRRL